MPQIFFQHEFALLLSVCQCVFLLHLQIKAVRISIPNKSYSVDLRKGLYALG